MKEHFTPSNLEKVFFPKPGYTKGDLLAYYDSVAPIILPYLKDRPMVLHRHPNGAGKKGFFQKDTSELNLPGFAETIDVYSESNDEELRYILVNNRDTLRYVVNLGTIELNPWESRAQSIRRPDFYIIDIDPGGRPFADVIRVALAARDILERSCEAAYVKTSGKSGLHVYVPLDGKYDYKDVRAFSELVCRLIRARFPAITSLERTPAKRRNKIYLDYLRNTFGQTAAAPYSVRPTPLASVSTPLRWSEVKAGLDPQRFTIHTIPPRLKKLGDLWKPVLRKGVDLARAVRCIEENINDPDSPSRS